MRRQGRKTRDCSLPRALRTIRYDNVLSIQPEGIATQVITLTHQNKLCVE